MAEMGEAHTTLLDTSEGKRKMGRPRRKLEDNIQRN